MLQMQQSLHRWNQTPPWWQIQRTSSLCHHEQPWHTHHPPPPLQWDPPMSLPALELPASSTHPVQTHNVSGKNKKTCLNMVPLQAPTATASIFNLPLLNWKPSPGPNLGFRLGLSDLVSYPPPLRSTLFSIFPLFISLCLPFFFFFFLFYV